jgi:hypothetical protein
VVRCGHEGRTVRGALVARVQDPADACVHGCGDRSTVQRDGVGGWVARRDEQELIGTREGCRQGLRFGVVAAADLDAAVGEPLCSGRITGHHRQVGRRKVLEQVVGGGAVEGSGGPGDDDHDFSVSVETAHHYRW